MQTSLIHYQMLLISLPLNNQHLRSRNNLVSKNLNMGQIYLVHRHLLLHRHYFQVHKYLRGRHCLVTNRKVNFRLRIMDFKASSHNKVSKINHYLVAKVKLERNNFNQLLSSNLDQICLELQRGLNNS